MKLLGYVYSATEKGHVADLSFQEIRVLNSLAAFWLQDKPVTVLNAIRANDQAVQATISKLLKALRVKGYIEFVHNAEDFRVKYVQPTILSTRYFVKMGRCLVRAQA